MKKIVITAMSFAAASLMFVACNKDEAQEPLEAGTAEVSGKLFANLDETSVQKQTVPAGTGVTFIIDGKDLDHNPSTDPDFEYKKRTISATVDADGNYSASLPAISRPYEVEVIFDDFEFEATIITTNDEGFQEVVTERRTFSHPATTIDGVVEGKTIVKNYDYEFAVDQDFVASGVIRGIVETVYHDNIGEVTGIDFNPATNGGSGYDENGPFDVTGGSGSGMTVTITQDGDQVTTVTINNAGEGYTIGDELTIQSGGNNAIFTVDAVTPEEEAVPAGVLLTFDGNQKYKVVTDDEGRYIVKLPADVTYGITGADFEAEGTKMDGGEYVTASYVFSFDGAANETPVEGSIIEQDYSYSK